MTLSEIIDKLSRKAYIIKDGKKVLVDIDELRFPWARKKSP